MSINVKLFVLVLMILGHLLADYPLQGWLATAKAKSYWENQPKTNQKDFIPALAGHAIMWGIIVSLPIFWMCYTTGEWNFALWIMLPLNILFHMFIDHAKANMKIINLWQDQLFHLLQIVLTWALWAFLLVH